MKMNNDNTSVADPGFSNNISSNMLSPLQTKFESDFADHMIYKPRVTLPQINAKNLKIIDCEK